MGLESWQLGRGRVWLRLGPSHGQLVGCALRIPRAGVLSDGTVGSRTGRAGSQRAAGLLPNSTTLRRKCQAVKAMAGRVIWHLCGRVSNHDPSA